MSLKQVRAYRIKRQGMASGWQVGGWVCCRTSSRVRFHSFCRVHAWWMWLELAGLKRGLRRGCSNRLGFIIGLIVLGVKIVHSGQLQHVVADGVAVRVASRAAGVTRQRVVAAVSRPANYAGLRAASMAGEVTPTVRASMQPKRDPWPLCGSCSSVARPAARICAPYWRLPLPCSSVAAHIKAPPGQSCLVRHLTCYV